MSTEPTARILVVDDNATARYVISSWLRRGGYLVTEAATGAEALTRVRTEPVDMVVLDVRLPDIDGYKVCEQIKSEPATAPLPVIHVSAVYVDVVDRTQGLTRGADAYLVGPVDPDELLATVHAVLRHYRARQRAEHKALRLARLVEFTAMVNAAEGFASRLQSAAYGTVRIFEGSAVVTAVRPDGQVMTAEVSGATDAAVIRPFEKRSGGDPFEGAVGTVVRREPISQWPGIAEGAPAADVWSVALSNKDEHPAVQIAVCAASFVDDDAPTLRQWGQAVALALGAASSRGEQHPNADALQGALATPRGEQLSTSLSSSEWAPLTRREREIARLVAAGHTNRKIAALLMIAKRTVDAHVERILSKLEFTSRAQIAAWVVERHLTGTDPGLRRATGHS